MMLMLAAITPLAAAGCGGDDKDPNQALEDARRAVEQENSSLINQSFTVTATMLLYPYTPADGSLRTEPGYKFVLVGVSVRNTGENPVVASYSDFILEADDGGRYQAAVVTGLDDDFGAARSPIPGSEESGTLAFAIPATAKPVMLWQEIGPEAAPVPLPAPAQ